MGPDELRNAPVGLKSRRVIIALPVVALLISVTMALDVLVADALNAGAFSLVCCSITYLVSISESDSLPALNEIIRGRQPMLIS